MVMAALVIEYEKPHHLWLAAQQYRIEDNEAGIRHCCSQVWQAPVERAVRAPAPYPATGDRETSITLRTHDLGGRLAPCLDANQRQSSSDDSDHAVQAHAQPSPDAGHSSGS
jgi:hypothetical protein